MTEKNMARADFYTSLALMAFGITAVALALKMPLIQGNVYSAPGLLPVLLGSTISALGFIMFIRSLVRTRGTVKVEKASIGAFFRDPAVRRIFLTILLCTRYTFFLGKVYFPVLTFLFITAFVLCFEYDIKAAFKSQIKKTAIAALLAFIVSAAVTLVFERLFLVRLP
jgi:hypothetical protein